MGTIEIFTTGLISTPFSVGVRTQCMINNKKEYITIEEIKIDNPKSSQDREQRDIEIKRLKEKYKIN